MIEPEEDNKIFRVASDLTNSIVVSTNNGKFLIHFKDDEGKLNKRIIFDKIFIFVLFKTVRIAWIG